MKRQIDIFILSFAVLVTLVYWPAGTFAHCNKIGLNKLTTLQAANNVDGAIIGDFNNDGILDLITLGQSVNEDSISLMLGLGNGSFGTPTTILGSGAGDILFNSVVGGLTADFNNDGNLDLLIVDFVPGGYEIFLGQGNGTFVSQARFTVPVDEARNPATPSIGDINNDGILDIVAVSGPTVSNNNGRISIFIGQGDGTFQSPIFYNPNPSNNQPGIISNSTIIGVADINGDGRTDLVLTTTERSTASQRVRVIFQQADGSFDFNNEVATTVTLTSINQLYDFNNDGQLDLLTIEPATNRVTIQLGRSDGTFGNPFTFTAKTTGTLSIAAVADFNGDNVLDLALYSTGGGKLSIYLGKGNGTFNRSAANMVTLSESAPIFFSGDFNNDGRADLIVHSTTDPESNAISIYLTSCKEK